MFYIYSYMFVKKHIWPYTYVYINTYKMDIFEYGLMN